MTEGGITLGDLAAQGKKVRIWCNICTQKRPPRREVLEVTAAALAQRIGPNVGLHHARFWLKCSVCGASGKPVGNIFCTPESAPYESLAQREARERGGRPNAEKRPPAGAEGR